MLGGPGPASTEALEGHAGPLPSEPVPGLGTCAGSLQAPLPTFCKSQWLFVTGRTSTANDRALGTVTHVAGPTENHHSRDSGPEVTSRGSFFLWSY